jgi:hypothetical protein
MKQQQAHPITPAVLHVAADSAAGDSVRPEPIADDALPVSMTRHERARLAVAGWASTVAGIAGNIWAPFGRALHSLAHPEPETMAQHRVYIRSRKWVPPELTGNPATVIVWAGFAYHALIGHPLKAAMKSAVKVAMNVDQAAERPLWFFMAAVFVSALVLILLHL